MKIGFIGFGREKGYLDELVDKEKEEKGYEI